MREITRDLGIILIFDETITLRMAEGGMQSVFGVAPDLTVMGKAIGGGLPIGAVGGLDEIINRRLNKQAIGFDKNRTISERQDILRKVKTEDLIEFGFESEFVGRLPVCIVLNELDVEGL